jgi:hypothetical protein
MGKIPGKGDAHQTQRPPSGGLSPFDRIPRDSEGRHPVDVEVEHRLKDRVRRQWIVKLQDRIIELTGTHSRLFLKLDNMLDEQRRDRERCYFNAGYEHGQSAARDNSVRPNSPQQERARLLLREFKAQATKDGIPSRDVVVAMLRDAAAMIDVGW